MSKKSRVKKRDARDFKGMPRVQPPVVDRQFFGTEKANGEPSSNYEERRNRCFELATYAVVFGTAPEGSLLVHGSWHGPAPDAQRLAHAWVELPGGFVWEPITAKVYEKTSFEHWTACWPERIYAKSTAKRLTVEYGTYGAWHGSKYPSTPAEPEQESA